MFEQLGVIGCGLMGGSFALALKRAGMVRRVIGYSKSPSTTEQAKRLGVIDTAAESALLAVSGSDIVLLAVPVSATEATFKAIRHLIEPSTLVMDVGSTKRDVVDAARRVLKDRIVSFVPAHPIAGKEVSGIAHADASLYQGRQVILTPLPKTSPELIQKATDAWAAIGSHVLRMSPEDHDAAFAAVSHLPHILAFAYFNSVVAPAGRARLPLARRPGLSRLHPHRREQPGGLARHPDGQPRRDPQADGALSPHARRDGARHQDRQHRGARGARAQRQRRARRLADELGDAAHAPLSGAAQRAMFTTRFLDIPPLARGRRHGARAGLEEHLEPGAPPRRLRRRDDARSKGCCTPTTPT